jgi:hypothetical protein
MESEQNFHTICSRKKKIQICNAASKNGSFGDWSVLEIGHSDIGHFRNWSFGEGVAFGDCLFGDLAFQRLVVQRVVGVPKIFRAF